MSESSVAVSDSVRPSTTASLVRWLLVSAVLVVFLVVVSESAPELRRRGLLHAIGFGLIAGFGMRELARVLKVWRPRLVALLAALLTAGGIVSVTILASEAYRRANPAADWMQGQLERARYREMFNKVPENETAEEKKNREAFVASFNRSEAAAPPPRTFQTYLTFRVSSSRQWQWPIPLVFWLVEIITAALLCASIARGGAHPPFGVVVPPDGGE